MSGPRLRMQIHGCSCEYTMNRHSMAEKVLCHGNKLSIRLTPAVLVGQGTYTSCLVFKVLGN
jgi:hypothetical protein